MNMLLSSTFSGIDILFLVILIIYLFVGLYRGLANYLLSFIGTVVAFILALIFCDNMLNLLKPTPLYHNVKLFFESIFPVDKAATLESLELPEFVKNVVEALRSVGANIDLSEVVSTALTNLLLTFICFLVILITIKIICFILKKTFEILTKLPIIGTVNKILGAVVGLINGALIISAFIYLVSIIQLSALDGLEAILASSPIAQFFSKYNIFILLFATK